ncbi:MAG: hypothetical protein JNG83_08275 [Opitutaceae bacterium]|nr:hypothetical protein [Opitutaceae bacterium]
MRILIPSLAVVFLLAGTASAAQPERIAGVTDKWRHLQSPNFELYTQESERTARKQLFHLEALHVLFFDTFKFVERRRTPVTVYGFADEKAFAAYIPARYKRDRVGGFFGAGIDRDVIVTSESYDNESSREMIFHEFIHRLVRATGDRLPLWYDEGMAELFATIEVNRPAKEVDVGKHSPWRVLASMGQDFMPYERLFGIDHESPYYLESKHAGIFYVQSWATLHYWLFGRSNLPPGAAARFLGRLSQPPVPEGPALREEFKAAFGIDYPEMKDRVERYLNGGKYQMVRWKLPTIPSEDTYVMRRLSRDEIRPRLAELALRVNASPQANSMLLEEIRKPEPDRRILEALGGRAFRENDVRRALELWNQAFDLGSDNPAVVRRLVELEFSKYSPSFNLSYRLPGEATVRMRLLLDRSLTLEPRQSRAYDQLAFIEAFSESPSVKNLNLIQRHLSRVENPAINVIMLALACHRLGRTQMGLELLDELEQGSGRERETAMLAEVRDHLMGRASRADPGSWVDEGVKAEAVIDD